MIIKRICDVVVDGEELQFKLTDQELREAYEEYLLISKIEDVSQVLKEIEEEDEYFKASDVC